jgi:hypothetical protein
MKIKRSVKNELFKIKESSGIYEVDKAKIASPEEIFKLMNKIYDLQNLDIERFYAILSNANSIIQV